MHPVDVIIRQTVAPALLESEFKREGRVLYRESVDGDFSTIEFRARAGQRECWVIYGVIARASYEMTLADGQSKRSALLAEGSGLFNRRLLVPGRQGAGADRWGFDPAEPHSVDRCGQLMNESIQADVLPLFDRCRTRTSLLAFLESISSERIQWLGLRPEVAERLFRLDSAPPSEVLAEVEDEIRRDGGSNPFTKAQVRFLQTRIAQS